MRNNQMKKYMNDKITNMLLELIHVVWGINARSYCDTIDRAHMTVGTEGVN